MQTHQDTNLVGFTKWNRSTLYSDIFFYKPDKWFKIWFYIVNRVNFKDTKLFKRGEALITYEEIMASTKATAEQTKKCIKWLEENSMLTSTKTTRGKKRFVVNYDKYQDVVLNKNSRETSEENNERTVGEQLEARSIVEERKKEKNEKSIYMSEEDFDSYWNIYPLKENKKKAKQVFLKIKKELLPKILSAVEAQKKSQKWKDGYVPHPTTWLNGERWEDQLGVQLYELKKLT